MALWISFSVDVARCMLPDPGREVSKAYQNCKPALKSLDPKSKVGKNRAYSVPTQRIYASGGVFEPRAERACLVQPRDAVARSLKSALPAGRRSRPLWRRAPCRNEPKRALAARQPRAAARASCAARVAVLGSGRQLRRRRILGWLAEGRRGSAWPPMHGKHT